MYMHPHPTYFYVSLGIFISGSLVISFLPVSSSLVLCQLPVLIFFFFGPNKQTDYYNANKLLEYNKFLPLFCIETELMVQYFWFMEENYVIAAQFCRNLPLLLEINAFHYLKIMTEKIRVLLKRKFGTIYLRFFFPIFCSVISVTFQHPQ